MRVLILLALLWATPVRAEGETAGDFDWYVLSLSWSSAWCAQTGEARGDAQCDAGRGLTFVLHGLWPSCCRTTQADATKAETAAVGDLMAPSLAWHEWKTHGRCSGLPARDYFKAARKAAASVKIPPLFAKVTRPLQVPPADLIGAFAEAYPHLLEGALQLSCGNGMVEEVRLCLTPDRSPRPCAPDVAACRMKTVTLPSLRQAISPRFKGFPAFSRGIVAKCATVREPTRATGAECPETKGTVT